MTSKRSPRRPPPRRTRPSRRQAESGGLPWKGIIIGGTILIIIIGLAGTALLGLMMFQGVGTTLLSSPSGPPPTPAAINAISTGIPTPATAVAATVQAIPPGSDTPTPIIPPAATQIANSDPTAVLPTAVAPADLAIMPATNIESQRDEDVDPVTGIATWTEPASRSEIQIMLRRADSVPVDKYVKIYRQTTDVSGNPVEGDKVETGYTEKDGILIAGVAPDSYILKFSSEGWSWSEQLANHGVNSGQRTNILFDLSLLTVGVRYADGSPVNTYVRVYLQEADVSNQPVEGDLVGSDYTENDGLTTFELTPGPYALRIPNLIGYDNWGRFNHQLPGGGIYKVTLSLGRLAVETWQPDGSLGTDVFVKIHTLTTDAAGQSTFEQRIESQYSDNTGRATFDLTPGLYGVQVGQSIQFVDIPIQPGQVTVVKQSGYIFE